MKNSIESPASGCSISYEKNTDSRGKSYFSAYIKHPFQGQFIIDDRSLPRLKERIESEIIPLLEARASFK